MKQRLLTLLWLCLSSLLLMACQSGTKEYLSVSYKGYDGYGIATVSLDKEAIIVKLYGKDATTEEQHAVNANIDVAVENADGLSNGDKVTVTIDDKSKVASKLKTETYTYSVSGLTKTTEISSQELAKKLSVAYTGISGKAGYPEISMGSKKLYLEEQEKDDGEESDNILSPSQANNLPISNGDMIRFTVEKTKLAMETGYVLTDDEDIKLEVAGLDRTPDNVSEIKNLDAILDIAQEQAEKGFKEKNLGSNYSLVRRNIFYRREYQVTSGWGETNSSGDLAIVYEYFDPKEDSWIETSTSFYVYNFSNLVIDKDGIVTVEKPSILDENKMIKLSAKSDYFYRDSVNEVYQSLMNKKYIDVTKETEKP